MDGWSFHRLNAKTLDDPLGTALLATAAVSQTSFGWTAATVPLKERRAFCSVARR